jgi:hypothetical protein
MPDWRKRTREIAQEEGLDPDIFEAQIKQESGFNPAARSPAGATGIAQIMPDTARGWGVDPNDPEAALRAAARNMVRYVRKYGVEGALRAYNAGEGAIEKSKNYKETNNYVNIILSAAKRRGGSGATPKSVTTNQPNRSATPMMTAAPAQPNVFQQIASMQPMKIPGLSPQLEQIQATTQKNWQMMADIEKMTAAAANRRATSISQPATTMTDTPLSDAAQEDAPTEKGVAKFEGHRVAGWIAPILAYARQQGWKGSINSGYRSFADQTRIYNSGVRPAAKPGQSNHEGSEFPRGAVDVTDAENLAAILRKSKYKNLLVWAGAKDPVHFSHPHNGSY